MRVRVSSRLARWSRARTSACAATRRGRASHSARVPATERHEWEQLTAASAHRGVPGGCVGCHGHGAVAQGGKLDHSFRADPQSCNGCHAGSDPLTRMRDAQQALRLRAQALAARLPADCSISPDAPGHASAPVARCRSQPLGRARFEIALVLEDRAAAVHNAAFARSLLDDAERQLSE